MICNPLLTGGQALFVVVAYADDQRPDLVIKAICQAFLVRGNPVEDVVADVLPVHLKNPPRRGEDATPQAT